MSEKNLKEVSPIILPPTGGGVLDLNSTAVLAHLKELAKREGERIKAMPTIGGDVTVTVIMSRPPLSACFTKGPHNREISPMVAQAAHEAVNEIARKNA